MLWLYVILGVATLTAALFGLAATWTRCRPLMPLHVIAVLLLVVAMVMTHERLEGRMALLAGVALELLAWFALRYRFAEEDAVASPADAYADPIVAEASETVTGEPVETPPEPIVTEVSPELVPEPESELQPEFGEAIGSPVEVEANDAIETEAEATPEVVEMPRMHLRTIVLFEREVNIAPAVFLASLRRGGQRDAALLSPEGEPVAAIDAGAIRLEWACLDEPCGGIEPTTLSLRGDDAEGEERVNGHAAHLVLTSSFGLDESRDQVVRIHHRAHSALTEFAPVVAAYWPDAGVIALPSELNHNLQMAVDAASIVETCTRIRSFDLDGPNAGLLLMDSVGLAAFGLPDLQVITDHDENAAISDRLQAFAAEFFDSGCKLADGDTCLFDDERTWRVSYTRSAYAPDREVVQIALKQSGSDEEATVL